MKLIIFAAFIIVWGVGVLCHADALDNRELVNINGTYYYISVPSLYVTHLEALRFCNDLEMKLISIQTEQKLKIISDYLTENAHDDEYYWTSGLRIADGVFIWSGTGEEITYYNWYSELNQPNESANAPYVCLHIGPYIGLRKYWDALCDTTKSFICESSK